MSLIRRATDEEIFEVLKTMKKNKSLCPDGFNVNFFLSTWSIVGKDFLKDVHHFLNTGFMSYYTNASIIALVPKVPNPAEMGDFCPISCCNTVYKCILKLIVNRLKCLLPDLIDKSQATFI